MSDDRPVGDDRPAGVGGEPAQDRAIPAEAAPWRRVIADRALAGAVAAAVVLVLARRAIEAQLARLHPPGAKGFGYRDLLFDTTDAMDTWAKGKTSLATFEPREARALVEQRSVLQVLLLLIATVTVGALLHRRLSHPPERGSLWLERASATRWWHWVLLGCFAGAGVVGVVLDNLAVRGFDPAWGGPWKLFRATVATVPPVMLFALALVMIRPIVNAIPPKWRAYRRAPASARVALWAALGTFVLFNVSDIGAQLEDLLRREVASGSSADVSGVVTILVAVASYLVVLFATSRLHDPGGERPANPLAMVVVGTVLATLGLTSMWWFGWTSALTTLGCMVLVVGVLSCRVGDEPMDRRRALATRTAGVLVMAGVTAMVIAVRLGEQFHVWFGVATAVLLLGGVAAFRWARNPGTSRSSPEGAAAVLLLAFAARASMGAVTMAAVAAVPPIIAIFSAGALARSLRRRTPKRRGERAVGWVLLLAAAVLGFLRPHELVGWASTALAGLSLLLLLRHTDEQTVEQLVLEPCPDESDTIRDGDPRGVLLAAAILPILGLLTAAVRVLAGTAATAEGDAVPWPLIWTIAGLVGLAVVATGLSTIPQAEEGAGHPAGWVIVVIAGAAAGPCLALLTLVPVGFLAADIGERVGPLAILIVIISGLAATGGVARFAVLNQNQPALFRRLRFARFPAAGLAVTWIALIVVVGAPLERIDATSHNVRTLDVIEASIAPRPCPDEDLLAALDAKETRAPVPAQVVQELCRWIVAVRAPSPPASGREVLPLVLVTASGGGVRAAAWTMRVLDCLLFPVGAAPIDRDGRPCPDGVQGQADRWPYLFAAGGASGGSVGIASAVAQRLFPVPTTADGEPVDRWTRSVPESEHVGGVATQMVAELGLATAGLVTEHDRAEELIDSWAARYGDLDSSACPALQELAVPPAEVDDLGFLQASVLCPDEVPLMLLNGTVVRTGTRFDISPLDGLDEHDALGLRDVLCGTDLGDDGEAMGSGPVQDVPLFDAAFLSARFPFVTPSGRLGQDRPHGCDVDVSSPVDVVDGGYHENSGAGQIASLYLKLEPLIEAMADDSSLPEIQPVFLRIENGEVDGGQGEPDRDRLERCWKGTDPRSSGDDRDLALRLGEPIRVPWAGYGNALLGRDCSRVIDDLADRVRADGHVVAELALYPHPGRSLPLGWSLTDDVLDDMSKVLRLCANRVVAEQFVASVTDPDGPDAVVGPDQCQSTSIGGGR